MKSLENITALVVLWVNFKPNRQTQKMGGTNTFGTGLSLSTMKKQISILISVAYKDKKRLWHSLKSLYHATSTATGHQYCTKFKKWISKDTKIHSLKCESYIDTAGYLHKELVAQKFVYAFYSKYRTYMQKYIEKWCATQEVMKHPDSDVLWCFHNCVFQIPIP